MKWSSGWAASARTVTRLANSCCSKSSWRSRSLQNGNAFAHCGCSSKTTFAIDIANVIAVGRVAIHVPQWNCGPAARARSTHAIVDRVLYVGCWVGFRAAFVRPNPCAGRTIVDAANEIVWETAEELDVTIGIHEGSQPAIPTLGLDRAPYNPLVLHATSHAFEHMMACAQLMALGVMERHPGLRFVFLEAGGGWAPYWIERLDHQVSRFGGYAPEMKLLPSEYFARQCWISFEVDEHTLPVLAPVVGTDRIVWGTDYPHPDCTFPGMVKELRDDIGGLPESDQARILGRNAIDLYRLPLT